MPKPVQYPDVYVFAHDYDEDSSPRWPLSLVNKQRLPVNASTFELVAPVYDNNALMGHLIINRDDDADGELVFELPRALFDKLSKFSQWYLSEHSLLNLTPMQGRIVKPKP